MQQNIYNAIVNGAFAGTYFDLNDADLAADAQKLQKKDEITLHLNTLIILLILVKEIAKTKKQNTRPQSGLPARLQPNAFLGRHSAIEEKAVGLTKTTHTSARQNSRSREFAHFLSFCIKNAIRSSMPPSCTIHLTQCSKVEVNLSAAFGDSNCT